MEFFSSLSYLIYYFYFVNFVVVNSLNRKRGKKGDKVGKGLRHFSMKVCEKVQLKGVTSYNEVADELVSEFTDPSQMMATHDSAMVSYIDDQSL